MTNVIGQETLMAYALSERGRYNLNEMNRDILDRITDQDARLWGYTFAEVLTAFLIEGAGDYYNADTFMRALTQTVQDNVDTQRALDDEAVSFCVNF